MGRVKNNFKFSSLGDRVSDGSIDSKIRSIIFLRDGKIAFFFNLLSGGYVVSVLMSQIIL